MNIIISNSRNKPIYEQIIEQIQNLIVTEVLKSDEMISSVRNLSRECGANPNTVQKAYNELERVGITYDNLVKGDTLNKVFVIDRKGY